MWKSMRHAYIDGKEKKNVGSSKKRKMLARRLFSSVYFIS
jgi:hypothetical protein